MQHYSLVPQQLPVEKEMVKRFHILYMRKLDFSFTVLRRNDYLYFCSFSGVTLWDQKSINDNLDVHRQPKTDLKISASDTLSEKASFLEVSASLKASFLGGLVEVGGSAKYLKDQKTSARQSRVTLKFSQTTSFEQLTMTHLSTFTYPEVFEEKTATHVVTAVLYGAQAFMVFDKTVSEHEDKQEIEGNLNVMVKKIPAFSIEGGGSVKLNDKDKELADNISCTFYGDYELEENPTTYMEALQLYKKLPSLLSQKKNEAVPVRVWLYPLARLDKRAAKLEREISAMFVSKIEHVLEKLGDAERKRNDLDEKSKENNFLDVRERIQKCQEMYTDYKLLFQKALQKLLPAVRGGEVDEKKLSELLLIHDRSPFGNKTLQQWLNNVQGELDLLNYYTRELSGIQVVASSDQLNNILIHPTVDTVVCFSFTSLKYEDPYLSAITEFLRVDEFEKLSAVPKSNEQEIHAWFHDPDISEKMKDKLFLFKSFFEANKDKKRTRFVIASVPDSTNPGTSIRLYRNGKMVDSNFQPVSKPPAPIVDIQDRNLILKLQKPSTGVTVRYRVETRITQPDESGADAEAWECTDTPDAQETFTLTGLKLANQYWVRYRAVSNVGVSEASDSACVSPQRKVNIPVGNSWNWTTSSLMNEVRKKIITGLGISRWSLSTTQAEVSNQVRDISTPYVGSIPGGLKPGMALYFEGVVLPYANEYRYAFLTLTSVQYSFCFSFESQISCFSHRFAINHKIGPKDGEDIAFQFNPRINDRVVWDSFRNGRWENAEHTQSCPLNKGSAFDIFIVIRTEGYEVYVNGQKYYLFSHRMPVEKVTTLHIRGDVFFNTIGIISNWSKSIFAKELSSGTSRWKHSTIQSGVPNPVCSPSKTYVGSIAGGLHAGLALIFQGVVPSDAVRFEIDLMIGPKDDDDIAFHFNARIGDSSVVCNSFRAGKWENLVPWECPFVKGGAFDIFMVVKEDAYEVIVNGQVLCTFCHRLPLESVSTLYVGGDVFMNTFGIAKVSHFNLTMTRSEITPPVKK
ncbi:hypothetical protein NFI96_011630 [Prochilodus magdalenae]|nr:hypothetical protein NFI96_011630 [Prochilodus magdalenae]